MSVYPMNALVPTEDKTGSQMPWNWGCRQLWASVWLLEIKPRFFGTAASIPNSGAISPAPPSYFSNSLLEPETHQVATSPVIFPYQPVQH